MTAFAVTYRLRADTKDLDITASEAEALEPYAKRVVASDAQRAISTLTNDLKRNAVISSRSEVKILEVKVIP